MRDISFTDKQWEINGFNLTNINYEIVWNCQEYITFLYMINGFPDCIDMNKGTFYNLLKAYWAKITSCIKILRMR